MIKNLTALFFISLCYTVSLAQVPPSPARLSCLYCRPKDSLVGQVRSVLAIEKRDERPFDTTVETYGLERLRIESLIHSSGREIHSGLIVRLDSHVEYVYDRAGRLLKEVGYSLDEPSRKYEMVVYSYDSNGRLNEETVFDGKKPFIKTSFSYDLQQRTVTTLTTTYVDDRVIGPDKALLVYNERGQWIKRSNFRSDGSLNVIAEFSYDDKGNLSKESRFGDNAKFSYASIFTHKYDSQGNWYERHEMNFESEAKKQPDWMVIYRVISYRETK